MADSTYAGARRLPQMDGLRALSVISVAWGHWRAAWHPTSIIPYGELGVDTFFVISGFLITGILLDNRLEAQRLSTLKQFYVRRFLRIFPVFYATLAVALLLQADGMSQSWAWHAGYLSNFYFYFHGWLGQISHFWSLAVEEQFYLFWPLLMVFLPRRFLVPAIAGCIIGAPLFESAMNHLNPQHSASVLMPSCMDALGVGALLAYGARRQYPMQRLILALLVFGITVWLLCLPYSALQPFGRMGEDCVLGWLVYSAAQGFRGPFGWLLEWAPVNYLGKISYGLYIIHNFAVSICISLITMLGDPEWLRAHYHLPWFRIPMFIVVTVGLASLSWHLLEKPINHLKRHFPYPVEVMPKRAS
jgi:peptidoglycan/LPS O-acetylase OafA/YrhL